jgi:hypothetical protein
MIGSVQPKFHFRIFCIAVPVHPHRRREEVISRQTAPNYLRDPTPHFEAVASWQADPKHRVEQRPK